MLIFEEILFVFFAVFGALAYGIATSKQKAIVEQAKKDGTENSEEHKKRLEEFRRGRASVSGFFWFMAIVVLVKIIVRFI